jgi:putative hydrolase of the HAD superfamily
MDGRDSDPNAFHAFPMTSNPTPNLDTPVASRQRIDAVVLDYGEVLCRPADPAAMARLAADAGVAAAEFHDLYWRFREDYDRGVFDGPRYWARVGEAAGRAWTQTEVARLIEQDIAVWTVLDERMLTWVEQTLDTGLKVALLSNMVPEIGAHLKASMPLLSRFTHLTLSCEIGSVKPEAAIYRHVLEGVGVDAERALLIDDRAVNIDGAKSLGMAGIVYRGYDALLEEIDAGFVLG